MYSFTFKFSGLDNLNQPYSSVCLTVLCLISGSIFNLRATELHVLVMSTNQNLCVRYSFKDKLQMRSPSGEQVSGSICDYSYFWIMYCIIFCVVVFVVLILSTGMHHYIMKWEPALAAGCCLNRTKIKIEIHLDYVSLEFCFITCFLGIFAPPTVISVDLNYHYSVLTSSFCSIVHNLWLETKLLSHSLINSAILFSVVILSRDGGGGTWSDIQGLSFQHPQTWGGPQQLWCQQNYNCSW